MDRPDTSEKTSMDSKNVDPNDGCSDNQAISNIDYVIKSTNISPGSSSLIHNHKKSVFGDITISVGTAEYVLDKVILASKSNYFYNKFIEEKYDQQTIAINNIKNDIFSVIVDIIYGTMNDLESIINKRRPNLIELLIAMDFLKMEIDLKIFKKVLTKVLTSETKTRFDNTAILKLFNFIVSRFHQKENNYNYILSTISKYISNNWWRFTKNQEFFSISYDQVFLILKNRIDSEMINSIEEAKINYTTAKALCGQNCAEWICYDFDNRIEHLADLVNIINYRYGDLNCCMLGSIDNIMNVLARSDHDRRVEHVEEFMNNSLFRNYGEIKFDSSKINNTSIGEPEVQIVNHIDLSKRWVHMLENNHLCDVIVKVRGTTFNLHRVKLSEMQYFHNLFFTTNNDSDSTPKEYTFCEVDPKTFELVIYFIYKGETIITSDSKISSLFKASKCLKFDELYKSCCSFIETARHNITTNIFEIFQYIYENEKYTSVYDLMISRIIDLWPKLATCTDFKIIPINILKELLALPQLKIDHPDEILEPCSQWILRDTENRFKCLNEVAKAINRYGAMNCDQFVVVKPSYTSNEYVKQLLRIILSQASLVPRNIDVVLNNKQMPRFVVTKNDGTVSIVNVNFEEIVSIPPETLALPNLKVYGSSATVIDDILFLLFQRDEKFYFLAYHLFSKKFFSLATDDRMYPVCNDFTIMNCNDEVYFCNSNATILKFSRDLNRWILVSKEAQQMAKKRLYTSDGKLIYKVEINEHARQHFQASFSDFEQTKWISIPDVPDGEFCNDTCRNDVNKLSMKVGIFNNELTVSYEKTTFIFNHEYQIWTTLNNVSEHFLEFTPHGCNILYVFKNGIYLFFPIHHKWTLVKELPTDLDQITTIHVVDV